MLRTTRRKTSEHRRKVIHTGVGYPPALGRTQHCNVLRATCLKTSEQRRKVNHTGVGYPPHSVELNTVTCYVRLTSKHPSNDGKSSTPGLGTPTLGQTQHCNVLRAICRRTSEHRRKVIHTGVGYPPHSVKLNTVTCYARFAAEHPSTEGKSSTPGLGTPQHSVKLNTVTCYARLGAKHPNTEGKSSTPGLGTPHTRSNSTL